MKKRTRDKIYNHGEVNAATDAGHILINSQTSYETDDPRSLLFVLLLLLFLFLSWSPDDHPKSRRGEWVWVRDPRRDRLHGELLFSTIASRPPTNPTYILLYLLQVLTLPTPMSQVQKRRWIYNLIDTLVRMSNIPRQIDTVVTLKFWKIFHF